MHDMNLGTNQATLRRFTENREAAIRLMEFDDVVLRQATSALNASIVCRQKVPDTFWSETMDGLRVSCGCDSSPLCLRL